MVSKLRAGKIVIINAVITVSYSQLVYGTVNNCSAVKQ
jgi:hypothetical protein